MINERLISASGKMVLLNKLLPKLFHTGHKVLIFSQMVKVLDLIEDLVKHLKFKYERLDGSSKSTARAGAVMRFNSQSYSRFCMLLSTRAGGLGLNLTAADTVIIFDSDWNPQNDMQAMARAHRIGQTKAVNVYRLITEKTYEEQMFHAASMKLGLDRAVLAAQRETASAGPGRQPGSKGPTDALEIDRLLKQGAYDVFRADDNDVDNEEVQNIDIDDILAKSDKINYDKTKNLASASLGSFSKASFVTTDNDDIAIDDENFWEKAIGIAAPIPTDPKLKNTMANLIGDDKKRVRRQAEVFDPFADMVEAENEKELKKRRKIQEEEERFKAEKKSARDTQKKVVAARKEAEKLARVAKREKSAAEKAQKQKIGKERKPRLLNKQMATAILSIPKLMWDLPKRDRLVAALHRFGFGRWNNIRLALGCSVLPLQDVEYITRQYVLYTASRSIPTNDVELKAIHSSPFALSAVQSVLSLPSFPPVRLPHAFVYDREFDRSMYAGAARRSLIRMGFLADLGRVMDKVIDAVVAQLGEEELKRRGLAVPLKYLDTDQKLRLLTCAELISNLDLGTAASTSPRSRPISYWDSECDRALVVGTFVHGVNNYVQMFQDPELPFLAKSLQLKSDPAMKIPFETKVQIKAALWITHKYLVGAKAEAEIQEQAERDAAKVERVAKSKMDQHLAATGQAPMRKKPMGRPTKAAKAEKEALAKAEERARRTPGGQVPLKLRSVMVAAVSQTNSADFFETTSSLLECPPQFSQRCEAFVPECGELEVLLASLVQKGLEKLEGKDAEVNGGSSGSSGSGGGGQLRMDEHDSVCKLADLIHANELATRSTSDDDTMAVDVVSDPVVQEIKLNLANKLALKTAVTEGGSQGRDALSLKYEFLAENSMIVPMEYDLALPPKTSVMTATFPSADKRLPKICDGLRQSSVDIQLLTRGLGALLNAGDKVVAKAQEMVEVEFKGGLVEEEDLALGQEARAKIALTIIAKGLPTSLSNVEIRSDLLVFVAEKSGEVDKKWPTSAHQPLSRIDFLRLCGMSRNGPKEDKVFQYIDDVFLPSCVWFATQNVFMPRIIEAGNEREYRECTDVELMGLDVVSAEEEEERRELVLGEKAGAKKTELNMLDHRSPIPDPTVNYTSMTPAAFTRSYLALKRSRLTASCVWLCGGFGVAVADIEGFARESLQRGGSSDKAGGSLPAWWRPEVHDVFLCVGVARFGLDLDAIKRELFAEDVLERWGVPKEAGKFVSYGELETRVGVICAHFSRVKLDPSSAIDAPFFFYDF